MSDNVLIGLITVCLIALYAIIIVSNTVYKHYKFESCKKKHLMFNQLKAGDYIWKRCGDQLITVQIKNVHYEFNYDTNEIKNICIELDNYETLKIHPNQAKCFMYAHWMSKYYTIYEEAETVASLARMKKQREINKVSSVTAEEFSKKLNSHIESLKKLGEDTIKELEVKL